LKTDPRGTPQGMLLKMPSDLPALTALWAVSEKPCGKPTPRRFSPLSFACLKSALGWLTFPIDS
jgi:hypothetical protein